MSVREGGDVEAAQIEAAQRLARATVFAFELCETRGAPLTSAQKVALIEAGLLEFDGLEASLAAAARVDELLRSLLRDVPPGA